MRTLHTGFLALLLASGAATAATIGGQVTRDGDATAIAGAQVFAFRVADLGIENQQFTASDGHFVLTVPAGTYVIAATATGFGTELYDDVSCPPCDVGQATLITVTGNEDRTGIDFALVSLHTIGGIVQLAGTLEPVADLSIQMEATDGSDVAIGVTDSTGHYAVGVADGSYRVRVGSGSGVLGQYFAGVPCNILTCDSGGATPVTMAAADVTGIDFIVERGGIVSGTLRRQSDGAPLDAAAEIEFYKPDGSFLFSFQTFTPEYETVEPLPAASYRIVARPEATYLPRLWNNRPCGGPDGNACTPENGDSVDVIAGATTANIDFALQRSAGTASGHVTELAGGGPLEGVTVRARRESSGDTVETTTLSDGSYTLQVPFGVYTIRAVPTPPLAEELFPNAQCLNLACAGSPTLLPLGGDVDQTGIDFALAPPGSITIGVRDADSNALLPAELRVLLPGFAQGSQFFIDAGATLAIPVLSGGTVRFSGRNNGSGCGPVPLMDCLGELYPDVPCPNLQCDLAIGGAVNVAKGESVSGIELTLGKGAEIAGQLREEGNLAAIAGGGVEIVDANSVVVGGAGSDSNGNYVATGLGSGPYFARTRTAGFRDELYDNIPCPGGACSPIIGEPLATVPGETTSGIDFLLAPGSAITGKVRSANTLQPIANATVTVYDASGLQVALAGTASDGTYATGALAGGSYRVRFDAIGFDSQLFDSLPCTASSCDPVIATPIALVPPINATGINADLDGGNAGTQTPRLVYINNCKPNGCVVSPGLDNAITNRSSIINSTHVLPPFPFSDAVFDQVVQCVRNSFAPFSINVTTADPGNVIHREYMFTTFPSVIGQDSSVGGVAPWACGVPLENAIAFGFASTYGEDIAELCIVSAHEIGHLMGLDHEFYCPDHMTYLEGCGMKSFADVDSQCGTGSPGSCYCGSAPTQNTFEKLAALAGLSRPIFANGFDPESALPFGRPLGPQSNAPMACGTDTRKPGPMQPWPAGSPH